MVVLFISMLSVACFSSSFVLSSSRFFQNVIMVCFPNEVFQTFFKESSRLVIRLNNFYARFLNRNTFLKYIFVLYVYKGFIRKGKKCDLKRMLW